MREVAEGLAISAVIYVGGVVASTLLQLFQNLNVDSLWTALASSFATVAYVAITIAIYAWSNDY